MSVTIEQLAASVEAQSTMIASTSALLTGLRQEVKDAVAACKTPAETQAALDKVFAAAEANKAKLSAALTANTEAE